MNTYTPEIWNIHQPCAYLRKHRHTIYRWIKIGKLPKPIKKHSGPYWDAVQVRTLTRDSGNRSMIARRRTTVREREGQKFDT